MLFRSDQVTKALVAGSIELYSRIDLLPILEITHLRNTGAAFSILAGAGGWRGNIVLGMKDNATRSQWLSDALTELSPREQTIIRERRMGEDVVTLEDLGKQLGISKERVRQLEQRAMDKLKTSLLDKVKDAGIAPQSLFMEG